MGIDAQSHRLKPGSRTGCGHRFGSAECAGGAPTLVVCQSPWFTSGERQKSIP